MKKIHLAILVIIPLIFGTCFNDEGSSGDSGALDTDNDGITDDIDNCVYVYNPDQSDIDKDGIGDVCEGGLPQGTLDHSYTGTLTLQYIDNIFSFNETTDVSVSVSKEGDVSFGTGTMTYSGEYVIPEQSKIERSGTLNLAPYGYLEEPDDTIYVVVDENTSFFDSQTYYIWNDDIPGWQLNLIMADNPIILTGVWNGGLTFIFEDAITGGSVTGSGSIVWTLVLTEN